MAEWSVARSFGEAVAESAAILAAWPLANHSPSRAHYGHACDSSSLDYRRCACAHGRVAALAALRAHWWGADRDAGAAWTASVRRRGIALASRRVSARATSCRCP